MRTSFTTLPRMCVAAAKTFSWSPHSFQFALDLDEHVTWAWASTTADGARRPVPKRPGDKCGGAAVAVMRPRRVRPFLQSPFSGISVAGSLSMWTSLRA